MHLKKPRVGAKEPERDRALDADRNGRGTYADIIDELEGAAAEDAESDVGQAAAAAVAVGEVEEWDGEVKTRVKVHLGTFVYPRVPFPYFFDLGRGIKLCEGGGEGTVESGEAVEKELDVKPQGEVEGESAEEKKGGEVDGGIVQKREEEVSEQKVDKATTTTTTVVKQNPNLLDLETRVTVIIPNGFIPLEKPLRPRIWGGGLDRPPSGGKDNRRSARGNSAQQQQQQPHGPNGPNGANGTNGAKRAPRQPPPIPAPDDEGKPAPAPAPSPRRRRRVYTDDSDLFLCALHSGWVTWTGAWAARAQGKDVRLDLRVLKCAGAPGGARWLESVVGREDVVGRFLGGWGERCFNDAGRAQKSRRKQVENADGDREDNAEDEMSDGEDDGRGLVSAAWGTTHDGSAVEVLGVEFVEVGVKKKIISRGWANMTRL